MQISEFEKPDIYSIRHFGILGMHWGDRRKSESKEVLTAKKSLDSAREKFKNTSSEKAALKYRYAREDFNNTKILDKLNLNDKSKTQLKLEIKYKERGMNNNEAAVAAYKNIRTRKIVAISGAVAIAAIAGYAAYKIHDDRVDKIIKSGTLLQNITNDDTMSIRDAFYSSTNKSDKLKYKGIYGKVLQNRGDVYEKQVQVLKDIKQASPKTARDTFATLMRTDKDFADEFSNTVKKYATSPQFESGAKSLAKGKIDKNLYEAFNVALVDHSPEAQVRSSKFYQALFDKGYNAVKDVNDVKFSGFQAKSPIISFKTSGIVDVVSNKKIAAEIIEKANTKSMNSLIVSTTAREYSKLGASFAGLAAAAGVYDTVSSKQTINQAINEYQKENPNTKKTYTEIRRMVERGDG